MDKFLFMSIPGFYFLLGIITKYPCLIDKTERIALLAFITPFIGFFLQQLYRLLFEKSVYFGKTRIVLDAIKKKIANCDLKEKELLIFWDLMYYSDNTNQAFRDHTSSVYHYRHSLNSTVFASLFGFLFALSALFSDQSKFYTIYVCLFEFLTIIILYWKANRSFVIKYELSLEKYHFLKNTVQNDIDTINILIKEY